jgi:hypothetical protein
MRVIRLTTPPSFQVYGLQTLVTPQHDHAIAISMFFVIASAQTSQRLPYGMTQNHKATHASTALERKRRRASSCTVVVLVCALLAPSRWLLHTNTFEHVHQTIHIHSYRTADKQHPTPESRGLHSYAYAYRRHTGQALYATRHSYQVGYQRDALS